MRSQAKRRKVRPLPKEETQAYYKEFAGRCVLVLSWQQAATVSYGELHDDGVRPRTITGRQLADPPHVNPSHKERLSVRDQTVSTAFHRDPQNALGRNIDPWKLRERFLRLDLSEGPQVGPTLQSFLDRAGFAHDIQTFPLPVEQIQRWQERQRFLAQWQKLETSKWKSLEMEFPNLVTYAVNGCGQFPANVVSLTWQDDRPIITWIVQDVWSAIVATVHFDKMRGIRLRSCRECGGPVPERRREPYCSDTHRHRATMRRLRAT